MNKKFSKGWIAAVNKTSTKLDLLRDLQGEAHFQFNKLYPKEREGEVGKLLRTIIDIDIQKFEDLIQASATDFEEALNPGGKAKKVKKEKEKEKEKKEGKGKK
jgi:hypothetical protein